MNRRRPAACCATAACVLAWASAHGAERVQFDPFAQATRGFPACREASPPSLTQEQARAEAHVRAERGTRCAMDGTCEPGGAYRRDPEINERVRALIAADPRFADTSVWVTTMRKWVTLQGCVRRTAQRNALVALVRTQPDVERVFDELAIGAKPQRPAPGQR
jgi:osmotically-inducible protein OsmY